MTCVVLHNILRSQYQGQHSGQQQDDDDDDDDDDDGCLIGGAADGGHDRNPAREAKRLRDHIKDYFNNEGALAWQDGRITRANNQSFSGLITSPFSGLPNIPKTINKH